MRTPYDTGKVKIGLYYEPPKYVEYDRDMLEIQKWMICDRAQLRRDYWASLIYMICLALVVIAAWVLI